MQRPASLHPGCFDEYGKRVGGRAARALARADGSQTRVLYISRLAALSEWIDKNGNILQLLEALCSLDQTGASERLVHRVRASQGDDASTHTVEGPPPYIFTYPNALYEIVPLSSVEFRAVPLCYVSCATLVRVSVLR